MKKVSNGMKTRRIITNAFIYLILAIVSILWLFPFFYIIIQSVRGDSTGISLSMFPSLDNPNAYMTEEVMSRCEIYKDLSISDKERYMDIWTTLGIKEAE